MEPQDPGDSAALRPFVDMCHLAARSVSTAKSNQRYHHDSVTALAISSDGALAVTGAADGSVLLLHLKTGKVWARERGPMLVSFAVDCRRAGLAHRRR